MVTVPTSISLSSSKLVGYGCSTESHETLAGRLGFEPRQVPPKGTVLPLDDRPALQILTLRQDLALDSRKRVSTLHALLSTLFREAFRSSKWIAAWCGSTSIAP